MAVTRWQEVIERLDGEDRLMLEGGALSSLFLRYPLNIANPVFVGGFYGILIGVALLPLYVSFDKMANWPEQAVSLVALTAILGAASMLSSVMLKHPPMRLEDRRKYLFPFPFLGLLILGFANFYEFEGVVKTVGIASLALPGPIYIQLSYAPRWRILYRIQRDLDPFQGMKITIYKVGGESDSPADSDLDEVVGDA